MQKWQQQFSIGYFVVALVLLFALQTFFASPRVETITYSQFKALARKGLLSNVVVGEKVIHGEIKPEGIKDVLYADRLKSLKGKGKEAKTPLPFTVVRVEDPELISDLEKGGVPFKGEVTNEWISTVLLWVVPVVLFFLLWSYLFKRMGAGGGMMQIGKSKAKAFPAQTLWKCLSVSVPHESGTCLRKPRNTHPALSLSMSSTRWAKPEA
jgi:cell division protease FtsH